MIPRFSPVHQREILLLPEISVPGNKMQLDSPQVLECVRASFGHAGPNVFCFQV